MMTASQCRAARALLGWSQAKLAKLAGVGISSIFYLEKGHRDVSAETRTLVLKALERGDREQAGVEFLAENGGGAGVRLKKRRKP